MVDNVRHMINILDKPYVSTAVLKMKENDVVLNKSLIK